jgi:dienelactone hydrolase
VALVLHGCGGFDTFDHRLAVELPQAGIATLYVDYFYPTHPPGRKGFCGGVGESGRNVFAVWQQEVVAAAAHVARIPGLDPRRIVVVGWSLGGGLAVASARERPRLFRAVVAFSTGFFDPSVRFRGMPPTLLLSGGPHDAIPLSDTELLYQALRASGVQAQLYDYGHGTHRWTGAQGRAGIAVAERFLRAVLSR